MLYENSVQENNAVARITRDGREQSLCEHAMNTALYAGEFGAKFGLGYTASCVGLDHDTGKSLTEFKHIMNEVRNGRDVIRGSVKHSYYGARLLYNSLCGSSVQIAEIVANCVLSHHSKLKDSLTVNGRRKLNEKLEEVNIDSSATVDVVRIKQEVQSFLNKATNKAFALSVLTYLLYSCVVDADRLDAQLFDSKGKYERKYANWNEMLASLSVKLSKLSTEGVDTQIVKLRRQLSEQCLKSGERLKGIYKLYADTGLGKTLASLCFALKHALKHGMSRIIYVIPYLSVTEQTASVLRDAIGECNVFEHHSDVIVDDENAVDEYKQRAARWDEPIIVTTQVQFMESFFSARASKSRKLHNLANSIIIFDEYQTLPVKCTSMFNSMLNTLHSVCGCTVLLCSAAQPPLQSTPRKLLLSDNPMIAQCDEAPIRCNIVNSLAPGGYTYSELADFILRKNNGSALVVVNTKVAAKNLYCELKSKGSICFHLSKNMCYKHRQRVFKEVKRKLKAGESFVCVSTQLIEAGVDISFSCGFRALAGFDSIVNTAGRIARNGGIGELYIVNIRDEKLDTLADIKAGADITHSLLMKGELTLEAYYELYYSSQHVLTQVDYPAADGGSLYDLLTSNKLGVAAYKHRTSEKLIGNTQALRSVGDEFCLIDKGQVDIIVMYGESLALVYAYEEADVSDRGKLLHELSQYSVSVYQHQAEYLNKCGALTEVSGLLVLADGFYHEDYGLDLNGKHKTLMV